MASPNLLNMISNRLDLFLTFISVILVFFSPLFAAFFLIGHFVIRRFLRKKQNDIFHHISHEIKTPLTIIQGYAELISENTFTEEKRKKLTEEILLASKNINNIIDALFRKKLDLTPLDLSALADKSIEDLLKIYPNAKIKKVIPKDLKPLLLDKTLIGIVFRNLLENAIKYSSVPQIELKIKKVGSSQIVTFKDQGIGIPKKHIKKIFKRFYSLKSSSGIGLYLTKKILEKHQAPIKVNSSSIGSEFIIFFEERYSDLNFS